MLPSGNLEPSAELHFPAGLGLGGLFPWAGPLESPPPPALVRRGAWGDSLTFCRAGSFW